MGNLKGQGRFYRATFVVVTGIFLSFATFNLLSKAAHAAPLLKIAWLSGTQTVSGPNINQGAGAPLKWSSSSFDDSYFDHSPASSSERLVIKTAGDYLIAVTVPMSGTVRRAAVQAEVRVNGTPVSGGIGESSYIRNGTGHNESSDHIAVLLTNLAVDDYVEVYVTQTAASGTINISGQASLYAEFIDANRTVFSATATQTTDSTNLNQTTPYALQWNENRKDTGFTHSDSTDPQNIILDDAGHYLLFVNIPLNGAVLRGNVKLMIQDDGVTVAGGEGKQGYIRNANGHTDSSIHWSGLISNVEAGSVITVQAQGEGAAGNMAVPTGKAASLFIEKVDASSNVYFARGNSLTGGTNWNPATAQSIEWVNDDLIDTALFTHSTDTNPHQITVKKPGDYLFVYNDSLTSTGARPNVKITAEVNGTDLPGAETKSHYIRSASGHNESSGSLVYLLRDLAADDVITISAVREAGTSTVNDNQDALLLLWFKGDAVAPALASAEMDSTSLVLTYTEVNGLDTESTPATTDFSIGTDGAAQTVTQIVVATDTVTLTLSPGVANADTVTVSYTAGADPIQDIATNAAANLVDQVVTNNTPKLVFVTQPGGGSVGSPMSPQPVVEIQDAGGSPITIDPDGGMTETVSLTFTTGSNEEGATLSGTATSNIDWSTGQATFSDLSVDLVGSYQLHASTNAVSSTTDSSAFSVTAGAPAELAYSVQPTNAVAGEAMNPAIKVQVLDASGNLVTTANNAITLKINDNAGGGILSGTLTLAAVSGVASFSDVSIDKAEAEYTLDATASGLSTATSASFDITVGTATQLVFSVQPINTSASAAVTPAIKVQVQDAGGNLVSTVTDPITLAINSNPGNGMLSGTLTVSAVNGEATFSDISIDKAGSGYTLDATASGLSTATSASFDISVGAATQLAYRVEPTNAVSTPPISPAIKVEVQDAGGNQVVTATNPITLVINSNPGNGTLSGTLTVPAVAGEATFSDVSIDKRGSGYSLIATAPGLTSAVSEEFNIVASDEAIQLAFSVQPGDSVSQATLSPAIKVQVLDAGGNLVETATDPITLAISNNPGGGTLAGTLTVAPVGGEATFNDLSMDKAGSGYSLMATTSGLSPATSADFDITAGAATQLVFKVEPSTSAVASSISPAIVVQVLDAGGNLVITAANLVTLGMGTNPAGTSLAGTSAVAAVGGEAVFGDVSIGKTGNGYTLVAHGSGLISTISKAFDITTGEPAKLVFSVEPSNAVAATAIAPEIKVQVQDAGGNLVTTAANAITLALGTNPGEGTIAGTLTVTAVAGEASFRDISIDKAGIGYTLMASGPGLTSATSAGFSITVDKQLIAAGGLTAILPVNYTTTLQAKIVPDEQETTPEQVTEAKQDPGVQIPSKNQSAPRRMESLVARTSPAIPKKAPVRNDFRSGLLNRERTVVGSSVTIRYRAATGLAPEIDVYDRHNVRKVAAAPMKEVGNTGVYEYNLTVDPDWDSGDLTIIASESTKGAIAWMTMTMAVTGEADVSFVKSHRGIKIPALLAVVETKLNSVKENLNEAQITPTEFSATATDSTTQVGVDPEVDQIQRRIREISELLKPLSNENGVNLNEMYESINKKSRDYGELKKKTDQLKILLDLNRELTEKLQKESRGPITKTWYESGSVILKILVVNPSTTETQTVPVKVYLPDEVSPKDILEVGDMKVDYDPDKKMYYVHDSVELEPGQSITKRVKMEDIWLFTEEQLSSFVTQAKSIASQFENGPYAEEVHAFVHAIEFKVQEILENQEKTASNAGEHIRAYREGILIVGSIKRDLVALAGYGMKPVPTDSEDGKVLMDAPESTPEIPQEISHQEQEDYPDESE